MNLQLSLKYALKTRTLKWQYTYILIQYNVIRVKIK